MNYIDTNSWTSSVKFFLLVRLTGSTDDFSDTDFFVLHS